MSTFNYDKMVKHEEAAKKALTDGNLELGFHHICQAAMCSFLLAKTGEENIAKRYLEKGNGLLELARQLKEKIAAAPKDKAPVQNGKATSLFQSVETPSMTFADVAGMDEVKQKFTDLVIEPLKHPDVAEKYKIKRGGGVLLYGVPGTGKTYVARALAGELKAKFYVIKSSDLISKFVGDTELRIKQLFEEVRKDPLAVIFIDEIDAITPDRSKQDLKDYDNKMVNALLQEIDGFSSKDSENVLLFLGATNRPYSMDSAFLRPGRADVKIRVDLPDLVCRRKILELFFKKRDLQLPENLLDEAARRTEGYNSADVDNLANIVIRLAFQEEVKYHQAPHGSNSDYTPDFACLFNEAFKSAKSSVNPRDQVLIEQWEKEMGIIK